MKKLYLYLLLAFVMTGCRTNKPDPDPHIAGESYTVQFGVNPEQVSIEEAPMSVVGKATAGVNLYGIQAWEEVNGIIVPYAYGLFNDESKMTLTLMSGSKYRFEMTMFPNGMETVKPNIQEYYKEPFLVPGYEIKLENKFILSTDRSMDGLNLGTTYISTKRYQRPQLSRFYGTVPNYSPTKNGTISIDLKWVVFGLTIIPEGLIEGKLIVEMEGAATIEITPDNPTAINKQLYTFKHSDPDNEDWCAEDYSETIPMKITWEKSDATKEVILDKDDPNPIEFKRRVERIIRVKLSSSPIENSMFITEEEEPLDSSEEITIPQP